MADPDRTASDAVSLERKLREQPYRFDFYQTLRRLEAIHRERPRLGRSPRPVDDCVRLGQQPSLAFAPSTLASYEPGGRTSKPSLKVHCFGLLGPNGPLPLHLTEHARQRLHHHDDSTFCAFLDMFHHRLLSLFYRAWADSRPTVQRDRPESDRFVSYVGSTFGMGTAALRGQDSVPDTARLFHSGLLACQTRHADGLRLLLEGYRRSVEQILVGQPRVQGGQKPGFDAEFAVDQAQDRGHGHRVTDARGHHMMSIAIIAVLVGAQHERVIDLVR